MRAKSQISRREALSQVAGGTAAAVALGPWSDKAAGAETGSGDSQGRIRHSVCRWCYGNIALDRLCEAAKAMGLRSVELLEEGDFPTVKKHGLICAMVSGVPGGIAKGLNRVEHHERIQKFFERMLPVAAEWGYPNVICFSGNRGGMSDAEGLEHCAQGLKRIVPLAERYQVNVVMELLNSRVDHADYMCDRTPWGAALCQKVGSERFKLLYDIYHMQIMEGDVIRTIRDNAQYIAHYHTGGVPGRNEIDETQELYYPAIMRAIAETRFTGYVAQEFIPKRGDALASLRQGVQICDV